MALSKAQFGQEYSRAGKPKKAYATREEAAHVAGLHQAKYGTVAKPYQGRSGQWHVATDREATASNNVAEQNRRREAAKQAASEPLLASDIGTREVKHVGTGMGVLLKTGAMRSENPRHGQYLDWVGRVNRGRAVPR